MFKFFGAFVLLATVIFGDIPSTTGQVRVAAIFVKFQNDVENVALFEDGTNFTPETCRDFMFGPANSVSAFYSENSYGQVSFTGQVFGPYVLPIDAPSAAEDQSCADYRALVTAVDADVNFKDFDIILTIYPRSRDAQGNFCNYCGFQGITSGITFPSNDGVLSKEFVWINGFIGLHVVAHEIGHAFGLSHANKTVCTTCYQYTTRCSSRNAEDPFDVMGYNTAPGYTAPGHFSAYNKFCLGWLNETQVFHLDRPGVYEKILTPIETKLGGIKLITLLKDKLKNYAIEYRENVGLDAALPPLQGLLIRMIDARKPGLPTELVLPVCDSDDAVLRAGQVFEDDSSGLVVEALQQTTGGLKIRIDYKRSNLGGVMAEASWLVAISLGDSLVIPYTVYNESPRTIADTILLHYEIKTPIRKNVGSLPITYNIGSHQEFNAAFLYKPVDGCGEYNFKLSVTTAHHFYELNHDDNYLTDSEHGKTVTVLCDGPELRVSLTPTPMVFTPGEPVRLDYAVENTGEKESGAFAVNFASDSYAISHNVASLQAGEIASWSKQEIYDCGVFTAKVSVDDEEKVLENNEQNNTVTKMMWSDRQCENSLVTPLFAVSAMGEFKLVDSMLYVVSDMTKLYCYSLRDHTLHVKKPFKTGSYIKKLVASSRYYVLMEGVGSNSTTTYLYESATGDSTRLQQNHPLQYSPAINESWYVWVEGDAQFVNRNLYARNLIAGEMVVVSERLRRSYGAQLTDSNLLFWNEEVNDENRLVIYDLDKKNRIISSSKFSYDWFAWRCCVASLQNATWDPSIALHEFDRNSQTLSDILLEAPYETTYICSQYYPIILDFDGEHFLYRCWNTYYLFWLHAGDTRCLNDILPELQYGVLLANDEIIGIFKKNEDVAYIGSVKIADIWNADKIVEANVAEKQTITYSAAPNPFNRATTITYFLDKSAEIELFFFNTLGQTVRRHTIHSLAGKHTYLWDGRNDFGADVASGLYFCALKIDGDFTPKSLPLKLLLLK